MRILPHTNCGLWANLSAFRRKDIKKPPGKLPGGNSDILSSGFLRTLFLYPDPNRASQAYGAVEAYEHTDSKRNGEGEYRGGTHEGAHDRNGNHSAYGCCRGDDGTRHSLIDREVNELCVGKLCAVLSAVFTQTVVDDDRVVDGITE